MAFTYVPTFTKKIGNGLVMETGTFNAASVTAGTITAGLIPVASLVVGAQYRIVTAGNTTWSTCGATANTVGLTFTCIAVGTGTGFAESISGEPTFQPRRILFSTFTSDGNTAIIPSVNGIYANQIKITCTSSDTGTYTIIGEGC